MGKLSDLTGMQYGLLKVVKRAENYRTPNGTTGAQWLCVCRCGNKIVVRSGDLKNGHTISCGCAKKENPKTHGLRNTRIYNIWANIKQRCYNRNNPAYKHYGERGITMDEEWVSDFFSFYEWSINNGYSDELTIDRIDNNGNYAPDNCRWVDMKVQANNTRHNTILTYNGDSMTISQWADRLGVNQDALSSRINAYGFSVEKALSQKFRNCPKRK